jgi:molecular chaperone DnaK
MKQTAEAYLGTDVKDAVITVPAYFSNNQKQATKEAGEIAGLNVVRIVNEPTAAALAYGIDKKDKDMKIVVFDLGGGTFDISILDFGGGVFEVLSTNGDTHLGGDDFDQAIIDWVVGEFKKEHSVDLSKDPMALQRIKEAAENAKIELSTSVSTDISLPYIFPVNGEATHFNGTLTRSKFEQMTQGLVERCRKPCEEAVKDAGIKMSDIDEVILVGGSTRIPAIQEMVEKTFGKKPSKNINPDEAVSLGAAIQGAIINQEEGVGDMVLLDVTPISMGIETLGGVFTKLIDANTTIPCRRSQIFSTAEDNQPAVEINVLQGERPMASDNKRVGLFKLDGIMPARKGVPQIEVMFDIDTDGILKVTATDKATGKEQSITIENGAKLPEDEIARMKEEAAANEESDKKRLEEAQAINAGESSVFSSRKMVEDYGDKLSEDEKTKINGLIDELDKAVGTRKVDDVKAAQEKLNAAWNEVSGKLYGQNASGGTKNNGFGWEFGDGGFNPFGKFSGGTK